MHKLIAKIFLFEFQALFYSKQSSYLDQPTQSLANRIRHWKSRIIELLVILKVHLFFQASAVLYMLINEVKLLHFRIPPALLCKN